jgi:hypothetical protein
VPAASAKYTRLKIDRRLIVLIDLAVASRARLLLLPPISKDQNYRRFADGRTLSR